jgi:signal transduction histidine kinase/CheY-like chemotaxis protein
VRGRLLTLHDYFTQIDMPARIYKKIINFGLKETLKIEENQRIRLTNILSVFVFFIYMGFITYGLYFNILASIIMASVMCGVTVIALLLNATGNYNIAKFFLFTSNGFCILATKVIFNIDFSIATFYFPVLFCYAVFYDVKEQWKLFLPSFIITLVFFVSCFLIPPNRYNVVALPPEVLSFTIYLNYLLAFLLSTLVMLTILNNYARTQKILIAAREQAEAANSAKSVFLSHMSHELRTPLNGIIGTTNLLSSEGYLPNQKKYFDVLKYSSEYILQLVNDVLDLSEIESNKIVLSSNRFNLKEVLSKTAKAYSPQFAEKQLIYQVLFDKGLERWVMSDDIRLSQIINNLLSNALKFTEKGSVQFSAQLLEENTTNIVVKFAVKDTGIGINENELEKIFENFTQVESGTTRKFGGTGLGLSISKYLAGFFGSRLDVKSIYGEGSEFSFIVNFETTPGDIVETATTEVITSLKGYRILIAEDNAINMLVVKNFLKKWEADFTETINGKHAIYHFNKEKYDLILLDLDMPELDGYAAALEIRKKNKTIPVIAFTAAVYDNMSIDLLSKGFTDYVIKPFKPQDLITCITNSISKAKASS